jgi:hypothetical protein
VFLNLGAFGIRNKMTLRSAIQDVRETTLAAVSGLLGRLAYLGSLRRAGRYQHWGMEVVHGPEASERALKAAHVEVVTSVLRTPIQNLMEDVEKSRQGCGAKASEFVESLQEHFTELLPAGKQDSPSATHLSSVLLALLKLEKYRGRATRSIS